MLVVDDEEPVRRVCRLALQHEAVRVDEAADGADAVARVLATPYDLILLDIDLPGLKGELVLQQVRMHPPTAHLKVMMFSGRTSGDDLSRLLAAGADDFLVKPFSVVQLRSRVKAMLRLKDAQERTDLLGRQLAASNADLELARSTPATANSSTPAARWSWRWPSSSRRARPKPVRTCSGSSAYCRVLGEAASCAARVSRPA